MPSTQNAHVRPELGEPASPFYGTALLEIMAAPKGLPEAPEIRLPACTEYYDDMFLIDPTVGVPAGWSLNGFSGPNYWSIPRRT